MTTKRDVLDFLRKEQINLRLVGAYLARKGYRVHQLTQPNRHVTGKISKNDTLYFIKMASRPMLSVYIENEYAWSRLVHSENYVSRWPLSIPRVHTLDRMDMMSWLTMDYIDGVHGEASPNILESTLTPMAITLTNIINIKPIGITLPLDKQRAYTNIREMVTEMLAAYMNEIGPNCIEPAILSFLERNMSVLQPAAIKGDVGLRNMLKDARGKIWLVDSEYASFHHIKFYDVVYYYFRLAVNGGRLDLAQQFLEKFRNTYDLTSSDERVLQWALAYRLVEGYFEAMRKPYPYYIATKELERMTLETY